MVPFFFFLKAVIPGHMEPIPFVFSAALSHRGASGGGPGLACGAARWLSALVVFLFVDMWSRAAYCRPDVGTHLQLSWGDADTGPSVSTSIGSRQLCVIPSSINQLLPCLFEKTLCGCWPNFTGMHEVTNVVVFFLHVWEEHRWVTGSEGRRRCADGVENGRVSPSCTLSRRACAKASLHLAPLLLSVPRLPHAPARTSQQLRPPQAPVPS